MVDVAASHTLLPAVVGAETEKDRAAVSVDTVTEVVDTAVNVEVDLVAAEL